MNKLKAIIALMIIAPMLVCVVNADSLIQPVFEYPQLDVTVKFLENEGLSYEKQKMISDMLVGIEAEGGPENGINNILCTILGHNTSTSVVSVIYHRVRQYDPRCRIELYDVEACSRCNYTVSTFLADNYISCHPEDQIN